MANALTYSTLYDAIPAWFEDDSSEFAAQIDTFIDLAEERVTRDLITLEAFRGTATVSASASASTVTVPTSDSVETIRYVIINPDSSSASPLLQKDESFLDEYWPNTSATGTPRYWAHAGNEVDTIRIAPPCSAATDIKFIYSMQLAALTSANTTNWLTTHASQALFYAALIEAALFVKADDDVTKAVNGKYQETLASVAGLEVHIVRDKLRRRRE